MVVTRRAGGWSRLTRWALDNDELTAGTWLHARVFPTRCDLSPDGRLFGYFAHDPSPHRDAPAWTAISRPPELTALAWWGEDTTWSTGPLFCQADGLWTGFGDEPDQGRLPAWLRHPVPLPHPHESPADWTDRLVPLQRLRRDGWQQVAAARDGGWQQVAAARDEVWRFLGGHPPRVLEVVGPAASWQAIVDGHGPRYRVRFGEDHGAARLLDGWTSAAMTADGTIVGVAGEQLVRMPADRPGREVVATLAAAPPARGQPPRWAHQWPPAPAPLAR